MSDQQTVIEGIDNLNKLKVVPVVSTVDEGGDAFLRRVTESLLPSA